MTPSVLARANPFATDRVTRLAFRLQGATRGSLLSELAQLGFRAALVGPRGSGKTTLLEALAAWLPELDLEPVLVRLSGGSARPLRTALAQLPAGPGPGQVVLVDGAEQVTGLSWLVLRFRVRRAAGLVVTAHRPGRLPTLCACRTSPELLRELVAELAPEALPRLEPGLAALHRRHCGDLRRCLLELYDVSAGRRR